MLLQVSLTFCSGDLPMPLQLQHTRVVRLITQTETACLAWVFYDSFTYLNLFKIKVAHTPHNKV